MKPFIFLLLNFIAQIQFSKSQDCQSAIEIHLKNINGGYFVDKDVTLESKTDGHKIIQRSNAQGFVKFTVNCFEWFDLRISNYNQKVEIESQQEGSTLVRTFCYEPNMLEKERLMSMDVTEIAAVNNVAASIADSIFLPNSKMKEPKLLDYFVFVTITIKGFDGLPLDSEFVSIKGMKRNKAIYGFTNREGKIFAYVLKGDNYQLNFKYHNNYQTEKFDYSKGMSEAAWNVSYIGSKYYANIQLQEKERLIAEEKRLKAEREIFAAECKKLGISLEEGYKNIFLKQAIHNSDTVVMSTLTRNNWNNKLIVCDLTGSMQPYDAQLAVWYQLHCKNEKNLQFVFFNDGDNKLDNEKKIGATGGIYYSAAKGLDSIGKLMAYVAAKGNGGDCPENNMEALIKGTEQANNFKELVAIVDNNAPVKDIVLLKNFNHPVHVVLCGVNNGYILPDYLLIAWKTKGSIHTMNEDITQIAKMSEGQEIKIGGITYRIVGGGFIRVTKV